MAPQALQPIIEGAPGSASLTSSQVFMHVRENRRPQESSTLGEGVRLTAEREFHDLGSCETRDHPASWWAAAPHSQILLGWAPPVCAGLAWEDRSGAQVGGQRWGCTVGA